MLVEICGQKIDLDNLESVYLNCDCMQGMREFPDKYFDLAIVDPPFGGGLTSGYIKNDQDLAVGLIDTTSKKMMGIIPSKPEIKCERRGGTWHRKYQKEGGVPAEAEITHWDIAPPPEYFEELFRVSKNQIIFGGNYFELPPTRCFIVWDKKNIHENFSMAMCEYAWTSFNDNAKIFRHRPQGTENYRRLHPCQKPVALYEWILNRYAKDGDIILDSHVGSASSLIACHNTNHKYVGFELDKHYYELSKKRLEQETAQMNIYDFMGGETE